MRLEWPLRREEMSRILIADDQRDVLEALRILLKGEGYQTEAATSLAGIFNALEKKEYALLLMDLNYARDTTSGQGIYVTQRLNQLLVKAQDQAKKLKDEYVSVEHLVLAMFDEPANSGIGKVFQALNVRRIAEATA